MDTLLGFLLDNTGFLIGLAAGLVLGAVLMTAFMRLIEFKDKTLQIAEANTLNTPHYGPPHAPRSRVPPRNPMITGELREWEGSARANPPPPPNPPPARPARGA